jgi:maltose/moltooligosaccharide transporter
MAESKQPTTPSETSKEQKPLKLNYKRTFIIGFAFFGILMLWQVYNTYCPSMLTELLKTAMGTNDSTQVQYIVGIIMAMDNVAALFMLPIFGHLSDKTKTPIGKRMPYIIGGTIIAAAVFPFIPLCFHWNSLAGVIATMAIVLFFMMMYRNPAVALMPDITPKPLRSRANGIINLVGYIGAICAGGLAIFLKFTTYMSTKNLWVIETPFLVASGLMLVTAAVLFFKIKENKIEEEMEPEMRRGEELAATEEKVVDDDPMPKKNLIMLILILTAEFLWFFSFNAIETFGQNYGIYYLGCESSKMSTATIILTICSLVTFIPAGYLADKIGRKWTIVIGLSIIIGLLLWGCFIKPTGITYDVTVDGVTTTYQKFPWAFYLIFGGCGVGWAMVNCCSFPMVVELCSSKKIGRFTGYYYAASMAAQSLTPIVMGLIFKVSGAYWVMPIYSCASMAAALIVFLFVKNVRAKKVQNKKGLEGLDQD